jgi:cyclohexanone monooxygenase
MSETVTESKPLRVPTAAELGIDVDALHKKYAEEREKRLRADGNRQYQEITGKFAHFNVDPYVKPGFTRPPLQESSMT